MKTAMAVLMAGMMLLTASVFAEMLNVKDFDAKDLRQLIDVKEGKRVFTIKYYPLEVYITGRPGGGFASPGEYQIRDFIRAEAE